MICKQHWHQTLLVAVLALPTLHGGASAGILGISTSFLTQAWTVDAADGKPRFQQDLWAIQVSSLRLAGPLTLQGYLPIATTTDDQSGVRLSGAADAQVRACWHRPVSRWRATLGIDLPTGQTALSVEEYRIAASILASRVLDLQLKRPGEGQDLFASIAYGLPLGRNTTTGLAVGGCFNSEYTLYKTADGLEQRLLPGNRLHISASLLAREHDLDPDWDLGLVLGCELAGGMELRCADQVTRVTEGIQGRVEATYAHRIGQDDRIGLSALLWARDRNSSPDAELPVIDYLGISTRFVAREEAAYTVIHRSLPRITVSIAHSAFRIDPWEAVNSYLGLAAVEVEQPAGRSAALYARAGVGFGQTVWMATGTDGQERRDDCRLNGTRLGVGVRLSL